MSLKITKYGASWCNPCKQLDPVLHELDEELNDVEFEFIDIETSEGAAKAGESGVMGIPRVFIYKDNEKVEDFSGFKPKEFINELINKHI